MKLAELAARARKVVRRSLGRPQDLPTATDGPLLKAARLDLRWYVLAHPEAGDAVASGQYPDARRHYLERGMPDGCNPNAVFSERWYREAYPDVATGIAAGHFRNAFEHFVRFGRFDGRLPNGLLVDDAWYRSRYPDAASDLEARRFASAYEHYLELGAAAGRDPHAAFSEADYRQLYPEVAEGIAEGRYLSGYQHFMEEGLAVGRQPHPLFDAESYRHRHPDVDDGIREGRIPHAYLHLITLGLQEGRRWKTEDEDAQLRRAATRLARCRLDELKTTRRSLTFSDPETPKVSILVVLFERAELSLACFESLQRLDGPSFELIVVDNGSQDDTAELLDRLEGAAALRNSDNRGFLRAANQAAKLASGELLLFLNNDAELLPSSLAAAVRRLDSSPDIGAVGGRVLGLDGRLQEAGSIVWRDGTTGGYGRGEAPEHGSYLFPRDVDYCSGVFLLTRRTTFERLDGFDEAFEPAYYEESDYCFRLRDAGQRVVYEPRSVIVHHGSASLPDETRLAAMLAANRKVFTERHAAALAKALPPASEHLFPASDRRDFRGRILMLDDHVPLEALGGGSPRAQEILHTLCELGYFVTFFATNPTRLDIWEALEEMPEPNLELVSHLGRPHFNEFWQQRRDAYDVLIVSRHHNFQGLLEGGFDPAREAIRVIYDAESVTARRRQKQLDVLGAEAPAESDVSVEDEVALARQATEIWAVSRAEAELLGGDERPAAVIAHGERGAPGPASFDERRGVLFVGRLDEAWNPNVDGLRWYLEAIYPRLVELLGEVPMTVVGEPGDFELPRPEGVTFAGRIEDLVPIYDRHRLFVATTRFAAGIPKKVTSAAAHGLPTVATSILVEQLGWNDGSELLDGGENDPQRFAERVVELYQQPELWRTVRQGALDRIRSEHGSEAMRRALEEALAD